MADHVIVIHRWSDRYADYAAYLDHATSDVSYVTTRRAAGSVPPGAAAVRLVPCTEDRPAVRRAVTGLIEQFGGPTRIVALHEADLDVAAELRAVLGVPGDTPETLAPFRNKVVMARRMAEAGIPLPATEPAPDHAAVHAFAAVHGWPVLLKPVRGTSSSGITRVDSAACLDEFVFPPGVPMLVQPYLPYDVVHVDGVATGSGSGGGSGGGVLGAWRASRYVNTCLDFTEGAPLGSIELDHPPLVRALRELTERAVRALSDETWVFHLEFFIFGDLDDPQLRFLEIGHGPGGAEVPFVWREVHGIDLMGAAVAVQLGAPLPAECLSDPGPELGGWLLVPVPAPRPCRVVAAGPRVGVSPGGLGDGHRGPYARRVPRVGETLPNWPGYEHAGARFRFRGETGEQIEEAMVRTIQAFDFRCQPVEVDLREPVLVLVGSAR